MDRACFHGGYTGAPKFVEKSHQKQIRSPFLVPLALLDLFSTSFVFSQRGAPIACRKMPILFRQSLTSLRATNRARVPMEIDELDANVIVVDDDLQAKWLKLVPGQQALPEAAPWQGLSIVCCT